MQRVSERRGGAWPARWPWSREGGAGRDGRKMAALKEGRSYGLSCGRVSDGSKVSVFHVKLTDSALRAFESYRASQVSGADPARPSGTSETGRPRAPLAWHPGLGARGRAPGVLLAGTWAGGAQETTFILSAEATLGGRPWAADGPELGRLGRGASVWHPVASGAFPGPAGSWAGTRLFTWSGEGVGDAWGCFSWVHGTVGQWGHCYWGTCGVLFPLCGGGL